MGPLEHDDRCDQYHQCAACLVRWLEAKWKRHGEEEDQMAASMLRDLAQEVLARRQQDQLEGSTGPAKAGGSPPGRL